jgi:hypothetical protein
MKLCHRILKSTHEELMMMMIMMMRRMYHETSPKI